MNGIKYDLTEERAAILRTEYRGNGDAHRFAERFHVSVNTVYHWVQKLGITHRKVMRYRETATLVYTEQEVYEALGCSQQVLERWMHAGCLEWVYRKSDEGLPGKRPHYFLARHLQAFISRYPRELLPYQSSLDLFWLLDLAFGGQHGLGELASPDEPEEEEGQEAG